MADSNILDSFHDPAVAKSLADKLKSTRLDRSLTLMHVCGTHEHAIARAGIRSFLPDGLRLVAGPGCPVCVCPASDIDLALQAAQLDGVIVTTFGDMYRVPAAEKSLEILKVEGHDVRVVYSPLDAADIAADNPGSRVVFMAVGFETTTGPIAAFLIAGLPDNLTIIPSLRLIPPALSFLLERGASSIDGFILPGHVSTVLGREGYLFLETEYSVPGAIAGFEPVDILRAVDELITQVAKGPPYSVANLYRRIVSDAGNRKARAAIETVFAECDAQWRGIGSIPLSGLRLRDEYGHLDAVRKLGLTPDKDAVDVLPGCICHEVILGDSEPEDCPLFGGACTPKKPRGPCMVSSEGTCRARYQYRAL